MVSRWLEQVVNLTSVGTLANTLQSMLPTGSSGSNFNFVNVGSDQYRVILQIG